MIKIPFILIKYLCLFSICWHLNAKEIALTFDDSPRFANGYFDGPTRARKLIANLKEHQVNQVVFFSVSQRLDEEGINRIEAYNDAGHLIANHTHSHPDFNKLSLKQYIDDFSRASELLSRFKNYTRYFRFPYLREGNTLEKRDGFRKLLQQNSYINAYITLNNYDWYIETLFQNAIKQGKQIDLQRMSQFYVEVMMESIEYYDQMAIQYLGRSPKHVLLLHEMDISALFIGDLIDALRAKGWTIISPELAYTDEIANFQVDNVLKFNPGRIGEIAKDKGQQKGLWHKSLDEDYLQEKFNRQVLGVKK